MVVQHIPVLLKEMLQLLKPKDGKVYFDGTFGGGGYTKAILEAATCQVISVDRDDSVKVVANEFKAFYQERFAFFHEKFSNIASVVKCKLDGVVLDLGISSFQLADPLRGFSFNLAGPVDMRMGLCEETALDVIRMQSEKNLADIIYEFGEERFSRRIAKNIKQHLVEIRSTEDLANVIRTCVRGGGRIDPSTRTFQALRIFVNDELEELRKVLRAVVDLLNPGGKILTVSFHSLEDRIIKHFFKELARQNDGGKFEFLVKKPIVPSKDEMCRNPRSRSAKLRGISVL
ncbi:MAG: 16S rRNA (cytosine(1402)-N(4))-methyltransferase RsmH [Holosporaceae bacterium]|jgi:16S rRNA (cytosine1402-N4)-methyltransferase|nr:16S rRNA (cytosine(1402)-N(4))-methyltransferase RsmH [Holosporaceae bacterium]